MFLSERLRPFFSYETLMVPFCLPEGVFSGGFLQSGKERKTKMGKYRKGGGQGRERKMKTSGKREPVTSCIIEIMNA